MADDAKVMKSVATKGINWFQPVPGSIAKVSEIVSDETGEREVPLTPVFTDDPANGVSQNGSTLNIDVPYERPQFQVGETDRPLLSYTEDGMLNIYIYGDEGKPRSRKHFSLPSAVPLHDDNPYWDHVFALCRGVERVRDGVVDGAIQAVTNPFQTIFDTVELSADGYNAIADLVLGISSDGARASNAERGLLLHGLAEKFAEGSSVVRTEMATEFGLPLLFGALGRGGPKRLRKLSTAEEVLEPFDVSLEKLPVKAKFVRETHIHETPNLAEVPETPAASFRGSYKTYVLEDDALLYRAGESDVSIGQYYSFDRAQSEIQARIQNAILPVWRTGDTSILDTVFCVKIPKGTTIHVGISGPQGGVFLGGNQQIYIKQAFKIPGVELVESYPLNQEITWNQRARILSK
jgi:hypothetical protein